MATVRSAAQARNRRRATLAGLVLVVLGVLLALTARAGATAGDLALVEADTGLSANHAEVALEALADAALEAELAEAESPDDPAPDDPAPEAEPRSAPESALEAALREALRAEGADGAVSAGEPFDVRHRPRRAPPWGRLDLTVVWRRTLDQAASDPSRRGALWLLATWSR